MSTLPISIKWGPQLIGLAVGLAFYGVSVGQYLFYARAFPDEKCFLKVLVGLVFFMDTIHTVVTTSFCWRIFVYCRVLADQECSLQLPWDLNASIFISVWVAFCVQCFYAQRVWIIGGRNKMITVAVVIIASAQLVLGMLFSNEMTITRSASVMFTSRFLPWNAIMSAICDAIITISIFWFLRSSYSGIIRSENYIQKLNRVFVQMGVVTFLNALMTAILYYQTGEVGRSLTAGPGTVLCKSYTNSMLAVLNARKHIRNQQRDQMSTGAIPSIPTIR